MKAFYVKLASIAWGILIRKSIIHDVPEIGLIECKELGLIE
jgi:hypothetical protein